MTSVGSTSVGQTASPRGASPSDRTRRERGALPGGFRIALDHEAVIGGDGSTIRGGSPMRLLRLTAAGARILSEVARGAAVAEIETRQPGASRLLRRLVDAGLAHPNPPETSSEATVQVIIPVRNRPEPLCALVGHMNLPSAPIVVDDASDDDTAAVARALGCVVLTLDHRQGPAGARNAGWRGTTAPLVAFVDSDCRPEPGTLQRLAAHFEDPNVGAAAPRIQADRDARDGMVQRYEISRSSEDMGPQPALARPLSKVAYVPTVLLMARREALVETGGFDEGMSLGEDVDLVWRLVAAGWDVRYDPAARAVHDHRRSLAPFLLRKFAYGSAAGALERRHPGQVASQRLFLPDLIAWLLFAERPLWGLSALVLLALAYLVESSGRFSELRLGEALKRMLANGLVLSDAVIRNWLPVGIVASVFAPRCGVLLATGVIASGLLDRQRRGCRLDPLRYVAIRTLDDAAYSLGVWWGCLRHGSLAPLVPRLVWRLPRAVGSGGTTLGDR